MINRMRKSLSSGSERRGRNKIKIKFSDWLSILRSGASINVTQINIFGISCVEHTLNFLFWWTCLYPKMYENELLTYLFEGNTPTLE